MEDVPQMDVVLHIQNVYGELRILMQDVESH